MSASEKSLEARERDLALREAQLAAREAQAGVESVRGELRDLAGSVKKIVDVQQPIRSDLAMAQSVTKHPQLGIIRERSPHGYISLSNEKVQRSGSTYGITECNPDELWAHMVIVSQRKPKDPRATHMELRLERVGRSWAPPNMIARIYAAMDEKWANERAQMTTSPQLEAYENLKRKEIRPIYNVLWLDSMAKVKPGKPELTIGRTCDLLRVFDDEKAAVAWMESNEWQSAPAIDVKTAFTVNTVADFLAEQKRLVELAVAAVGVAQ